MKVCFSYCISFHAECMSVNLGLCISSVMLHKNFLKPYDHGLHSVTQGKQENGWIKLPFLLGKNVPIWQQWKTFDYTPMSGPCTHRPFERKNQAEEINTWLLKYKPHVINSSSPSRQSSSASQSFVLATQPPEGQENWYGWQSIKYVSMLVFTKLPIVYVCLLQDGFSNGIVTLTVNWIHLDTYTLTTSFHLFIFTSKP